MVEDKKSQTFGIIGVLGFIPLTFRNAWKGEVWLRYEDGKEISLDRLWEKYITERYPGGLGRWINLNITLLDYDEEKDIKLIREIMGRGKDYIDDIYENMEEDNEKDIKILTKIDKGKLFVKPYSFIDRMGWGEELIIGYRPFDYGDPFGESSISLTRLLKEFIGREVILTLRIEALDEDEDEDYFEDKNSL